MVYQFVGRLFLLCYLIWFGPFVCSLQKSVSAFILLFLVYNNPIESRRLDNHTRSCLKQSRAA